MTMNAFVDHLSVALGESTFTVDEAARAGKTRSSAAALAESGFRLHHVCGAKTTAYDLACRAVESIRAALGDIGAIVYATCIPANGSVGEEKTFRETGDVKYLMDFPASRLQSAFRMDRAVVIGLNQQACTGMLGSLRLARMLLRAEPEVGRVLCLTADRFPEGALYEQSYNLISDGAAACVVSREPRGFRLLACHGITNGALASASDDEVVGTYFSYTHRVIQETLDKAKLNIEDVDWIVPQNTNIKAWQILARLLKFDFARVALATLGDVGHMISGDNIANLKRLLEDREILPGAHVLLVTAGYGLNWQCAILEKAAEHG
jgi:3-oxoacyl-[acyl-carrier-protein] synthase-3